MWVYYVCMYVYMYVHMHVCMYLSSVYPPRHYTVERELIPFYEIELKQGTAGNFSAC
jgi:hypothetical protein